MGTQEINLADLPPASLAALHILGKRAEKLRDRLDVGDDQPVDLELRIRGQVHVGGTSTYEVKDRPTDRHLLSMLLDALTPRTRNAAVTKVLNLCKRFVDGGDPPEIRAESELWSKELAERTTRVKMEPRRGTVSGELVLERLS
jgi:hypothetical protein